MLPQHKEHGFLYISDALQGALIGTYSLPNSWKHTDL